MDDSRPPDVRTWAVAVAATGGALALVGITLPWAAVRASDQRGQAALVQLSDFGPLLAPTAAIVLIFIGVGAVFCLGPAHRLSSMLWWSTALTAIVGAAGFLFLTTTALLDTELLVRNPITFTAQLLTVGSSIPSTGCVLYVVGLIMVVLGISGAEVARRGTAVDERSPEQRSADAELVRTVRRGAQRLTLAVALVTAAASVLLPWFHLQPTPLGSADLSPIGVHPGDVQVWSVSYRGGLFVCLALIVFALAVRPSAVAVRVAGLICATAVLIVLALGFVVLWQPITRLIDEADTIYATLRPGLGFGLGILTMIVLVLSFALLQPAPQPTAIAAEDPS